ncbi:MAG: hypothetical protein H5T65_07035 [Chloroflexi bacterium]|nr:hypothetical protein [Chloroflexota bacterium]
MRVLTLEGTPYEMGLQYGALPGPLRQFVVARIYRRLRRLVPHPQTEAWYAEVLALLEHEAEGFLQYVQGQTDGLGIERDVLLRFSLASYLEDRAQASAAVAEGCTAWAARPDWTETGQPLLAKNRDQNLEQLGLQCVVRARPTSGYPYVGVTALGWPGLASSGLNAAGLAVADTHVPSTDLGPGLPRWWMMVCILERCRTVGEALDYLTAAPRLGNGNLVLADAQGAIAVFEEGHAHFGIRTPEDEQGYLVASNHFVTDLLRNRCRLEGLGKKGDTLARKARMEAALAEAKGVVSPSWARVIMSSADGTGALCWQDPERHCGTISTVIVSPATGTIWVRHGWMWHGRFRRFVMSDFQWANGASVYQAVRV